MHTGHAGHSGRRPPQRHGLRALHACAGCLVALLPTCAAQAGTSTGLGLGTPAGVDLKFTVNIDKFVFFRLGDSAWPTLSGTVSSAAFVLTPSIPGGPTTPNVGNHTAANWSGGAPTFSVTPSAGFTLAVEVRSNGGPVSLRATVASPLTNGTTTIPMSEIAVTSSNNQLLAPAIPASGGPGSSVTVTPTDLTGFVTQSSANWTFKYLNSANRPAGNYQGTVTFTASAP